MKKVITIILTTIMILSVASTAYAADPITKDQYYARSMLSGDELEFYDHVYDTFASGSNTVYPDDYGLTNDQAVKIGAHVFGDAPELFNYKGYYSDEEVDALNAQLQEKSKEILGLIPDNATEYEKVESIYKWIASNILYNKSAERDLNSNTDSKVLSDSQTIIGGLINESAICGGIADSFQYLLYQEGILCFLISGTMDGYAHTWNMLKIDGEWYYADPTNAVLYDFVLMDDATLKKNGLIPDSFNPPLPACTSTKYMRPEPTAAPTVKPVPQPTIMSANLLDVQSAEPVDAQTTNNYTLIYFILIAVVAVAVITVLLVRRKKRI